MEKLAAGNYIERLADAGHAYRYRCGSYWKTSQTESAEKGHFWTGIPVAWYLFRPERI
jgi:hypothetical protein